LEFDHKVKQNDVVVVGSDGLFDNVSGNQIKECVETYLQKNSFDSKSIARELAKMTYKLSLDSSYNSPFGIRARQYGYKYTGGKSDDITVVVGKVNLLEN